MIRITNMKILVTEVPDIQTEMLVLRKKILSRLKICDDDLKHFEISKKSIDARKKNEILYVYTVDVQVENEKRFLSSGKDITCTPDRTYRWGTYGNEALQLRPVIIGTGPAGLFAGLMLARNGYRPILLERGENVDDRSASVSRLWKGGKLDTESNVQFGEGGAGTFSDGKLTTLINDPRCHTILKEFVRAGAPPEILYAAKPHIGTDLLKSTVKNIRNEIIVLGGEVRFQAKVTDFIIENGSIQGVAINENEILPCTVVLLAIGHSARDTFDTLYQRGVRISPKSFSIGVRIEHPQVLINRAQYGIAADSAILGAADYKLSFHSKSGRSAYTFCMCPGGYVVAAASEKEGVVTNGMSEYKRDGKNANAALLVGVSPTDFESEHPLAGVAFQRKWERFAYQLGGENYSAPAQRVEDFLLDRQTTQWGSVEPTYQPGVTFARLNQCLPEYVISTMKEALVDFDKKIKGFAMADGILTGVETRSSSPIRIHRDERFLSNIDGLYPVGEGAGYAGGIMSSAVDGVKTAEKVMGRYARG